MSEIENDKFDWSTMAGVVERHARNPIQSQAAGYHSAVMGAIDRLRDAVYPVNFHFRWNGLMTTVSLKFRNEVTAPRRNEPIFLTFRDDTDGKTYRISSVADYTTHNYYDSRTLSNIDRDGIVLDVYLKPVTIQPSDAELHEEYTKEYGEVPDFDDWSRERLNKSVAATHDE